MTRSRSTTTPSPPRTTTSAGWPRWSRSRAATGCGAGACSTSGAAPGAASSRCCGAATTCARATSRPRWCASPAGAFRGCASRWPTCARCRAGGASGASTSSPASTTRSTTSRPSPTSTPRSPASRARCAAGACSSSTSTRCGPTAPPSRESFAVDAGDVRFVVRGEAAPRRSGGRRVPEPDRGPHARRRTARWRRRVSEHAQRHWPPDTVCARLRGSRAATRRPPRPDDGLRAASDRRTRRATRR